MKHQPTVYGHEMKESLYFFCDLTSLTSVRYVTGLPTQIFLPSFSVNQPPQGELQLLPCLLKGNIFLNAFTVIADFIPNPGQGGHK
jgi:hypothetical protein